LGDQRFQSRLQSQAIDLDLASGFCGVKPIGLAAIEETQIAGGSWSIPSGELPGLPYRIAPGTSQDNHP
jgi:hypothetical protein